MLYRTQNPHGGDRYARAVTLDFSSNVNPLGTPPSVRRAVVRAAEALERYPDPCCRALTAALSEYEGVPEPYILCGCGAAELIFSYCAALRPKRAVELAPTFSEYSAALESVGCRVERYALSAEKGFALGSDFLPYLQAAAVDAVFLCTPNNPTGRLIDHALLLEIAALCRRREIRLFVDECFLDLSDGGRAMSLKSQLAAQPGLFLLKAFTKSYGMAGLRLGYCLSADGALLTAMGRAVQPWNVSTLAQAAGVAALGEETFLEEARQLIREQRMWLARALEGLGLTVCPSQANYLLLYSREPLFEALLARGILIRDCANYRGLGQGWYRVAVRLPEENRALAAALRAVLKKG